MEKNKKKKAVTYSRTSSRKQSYDSIEYQKDQARLYADYYGLDIIDEYEDVAKSGRTDKRDDFQRLISDSDKFDAVLVLRYDRWARNVDIATSYEQKLNDNSAVLISITEDEQKKLAYYQRAQESSDHKSEAVIKKMNGLADENMHLGGPMMLGFSKGSDGRYVINPNEASLVREIFRRYADGETVEEIVSDLNARQITAAERMDWDRKTLQNMLQNKKYIGVYSWGEKSDDAGIPQIVSNEVFDQVQKKLQENASRGARSKASCANEYMLSGKLRCGCCGDIMTGNTSNGIHYYTCKNKDCRKTSLRKNDFEEMIFDLTCEFLTDKNSALIAKKYAEYRADINPEEEINRLEYAIDKKKTVAYTLPQNSETREQFEHEISGLENALENEMNKVPFLSEDEVRFFLHELYIGNIDAWYLRKFILDTLVSSVMYDGNLLTIDFNLDARFMNDESDSHERYLIAWADPDETFSK